MVSVELVTAVAHSQSDGVGALVGMGIVDDGTEGRVSVAEVPRVGERITVHVERGAAVERRGAAFAVSNDPARRWRPARSLTALILSVTVATLLSRLPSLAL